MSMLVSAAHFMGHPLLHASLSAMAMLGPGREIMTSGLTQLARGQPDMDSLVALGATATTAVSAAAFLRPALGWHTYFEEPAMLLAFVMVGRTLEERAKLRAASDMTALRGLLPRQARVVMPSGEIKEVPSEDVAPGDVGDQGTAPCTRFHHNSSALLPSPPPLSPRRHPCRLLSQSGCSPATCCPWTG